MAMKRGQTLANFVLFIDERAQLRGFHKKNRAGLQQFATVCSRDKCALHIGCSAGPHVVGH